MEKYKAEEYLNKLKSLAMGEVRDLSHSHKTASYYKPKNKSTIHKGEKKIFCNFGNQYVESIKTYETTMKVDKIVCKDLEACLMNGETTPKCGSKTTKCESAVNNFINEENVLLINGFKHKKTPECQCEVNYFNEDDLLTNEKTSYELFSDAEFSDDKVLDKEIIPVPLFKEK